MPPTPAPSDLPTPGSPNFGGLEDVVTALPAEWRDLLLNAGPGDLDQIDKMLEDAAANRQLDLFQPSIKQREFLDAGGKHHIRMFRAGNRTGKSYVAAYEIACHASGQYPDWWQGKRFSKPGIYWCLCETSELTRDVQQTRLIGAYARRDDWGTNCFLSKEVLDLDNVLMRHGVPGAIDTISVKHLPTGGWSQIQFKAHSFGRERLQGAAVNAVWLDEEPDLPIVTECATRIATTSGCLLLTMTPLSGTTKLVEEFARPDGIGHMVTASLYDGAKSRGGHLADEEIERLISSWPEHERKARIFGLPFLGSGLVFPVRDSDITCEPFEVPSHWKQIGGMDLGHADPSAFVRLVWDDPKAGGSDTMYVIAARRVKDTTPMMHAAAVLPWGRWLPWAWPHDANRRGITGGGDSLESFRSMYERHGLKMLPEHATNEHGGNNREQATAEMLERFQTGRLKVFSHLTDLLDEIRMYSRKDGILDHEPDTISAARYAMMMMARHGVVPGSDGKRSNWSKPLRRNIRRLT
jgi:phage terminase large subunit-like protein